MRETSIVQVSFEATEPKLAARVANAYTSAYLDYNLKQRIESTTEASQWLEEQLAKAEEQVMKSADTLRQYQGGRGPGRCRGDAKCSDRITQGPLRQS